MRLGRAHAGEESAPAVRHEREQHDPDSHRVTSVLLTARKPRPSEPPDRCASEAECRSSLTVASRIERACSTPEAATKPCVAPPHGKGKRYDMVSASSRVAASGSKRRPPSLGGWRGGSDQVGSASQEVLSQTRTRIEGSSRARAGHRNRLATRRSALISSFASSTHNALGTRRSAYMRLPPETICSLAAE